MMYYPSCVIIQVSERVKFVNLYLVIKFIFFTFICKLISSKIIVIYV